MERSGLRRQTLDGVRRWLGDESGASRLDRVFPAFLGGAVIVVLVFSLIGHERAQSAAASSGAGAERETERRVISSSSRGEVPVEPAEGAARGHVSDNYPALAAPRLDTEQQRLDAEAAIARQQMVLPEPTPENDPAAAEAAAEGEAPAETTAEGEAAAAPGTDGS